MTTARPIRLNHGDVVFVRKSRGETPEGHELWSNRPAVVLSNQGLAETARVVTVVYLKPESDTRTPRLSHINVGQIADFKSESVAMCEQLYTIDKSRLRYLERLDDNALDAVKDAVADALDL